MPQKLSKQSKKHLRKNADELRKNRSRSVLIISDKCTTETLDHYTIEAANLGIKLEKRERWNRYEFYIPDYPDYIASLRIHKLRKEKINELEFHQDFIKIDLPSFENTPLFEIKCRAYAHPLNYLLLMTLVRVSGRLTKGLYIDEELGIISSKWTSWSLDDEGTTMFDIQPTYEPEFPDFKLLKTNYPKIFAERHYPLQ